MSPRLVPLLAAFACACGGHEHPQPDPSSVPIAPIAFNAVFVVNGEDSSIGVINADTDELAGTIQLENVDFPHHVYLSSDGNIMLVAVPGADLSGGHTGGHEGHGGAVLVLDATTGALQAFRRLEAPNHNAIYQGTEAIWTAASEAPGSVLVLDPVTLVTRRSIQVGNDPSEITFSGSDDFAFVANTGSDTVSVIDPVTQAVVQTVPVGDAPVGAWPGSDGVMYVDNELGRSITAINSVTFEVVATYDLGFTPGYAAVPPTGELWVTDSDAGQLVFFDTVSGARLGELPTGAGAHAIVVSPSGAKAWVSNQAAASVSVIDVASKTVLRTITVGAKPNGLVYRTNN